MAGGGVRGELGGRGVHVDQMALLGPGRQRAGQVAPAADADELTAPQRPTHLVRNGPGREQGVAVQEWIHGGEDPDRDSAARANGETGPTSQTGWSPRGLRSRRETVRQKGRCSTGRPMAASTAMAANRPHR